MKKAWEDSPASTFILRIDRYIIVKFLGTYIFAIALIISIAVVFDFNENLDRFVQNNAPMKRVFLDYYMSFIPYFSNLFSPLFVFISVIFFTTKLADNSEIIAMMSNGMSFNRIMRPYLISAAIVSLSTFYLGSEVIPKGNVDRVKFENQYKRRRSQVVNYAHDVQLEVDSGVIAYIGRFENINKTGYQFSLDKFVDKKLVSHLTANSISYDTLADDRYHWVIKDYTIRELKGMREYITRGNRKDSIIKMEPGDFLIMKGQEGTLTSAQLEEYISKQKQRGFANIKQFEVEYHRRIAQSFAAFILTIMGLSISARKRKGGMGISLGIGLALSFGYILFQTISSTFAINANVPPMIAVWMPNILFA
ncbi:MAG: YjgP/YjgQ family permease, partial [Bacteroidaceae bacterium]|nr:YjgP/YjgQ family permease [Bacteroidaceae bacterium]